ncbi:MAG: ferrous iron transport protein B [Aureispira sp.]|nr:ferrous iron transport protein B [Aureispira sp.]
MLVEEPIQAISIKNIALIGNPNAGKTSLFNSLTGMNQHVGNFTGVTVDKKVGQFSTADKQKFDLIDLPGIYSLFAKSEDEHVVLETLLNPETQPDLVIILLDALHLQRSLLLFTQIQDLGFRVLPVLNMLELAEQEGNHISITQLEEHIAQKIVTINARTGKGISSLKEAVAKSKALPKGSSRLETISHEWENTLKINNLAQTNFAALLMAVQYQNLSFLNTSERASIADIIESYNINILKVQVDNTAERLGQIHDWLHPTTNPTLHIDPPSSTFTSIADKIILHPIGGYLIFLGVLMVMFQAIFSLAAYPMDWIDAGMANLITSVQSTFPEHFLTALFTDGLLAGIGGVLIFVPQIAILFAFIAVLEESGYMSRVMFIMDKIMRRFGLNGQSVVPLVSGLACAVPAIMAARSIPNGKERLITIFVTPFISCAARLPVYLIIIALVIPNTTVFGFFGLQGLVLLGLYLAGLAATLITAWLANLFIKSDEESFFIMDLPTYKMPRWKNIGITIWQKIKTFVWDAGKIIVALSILLWVLASYGSPEAMQAAETTAKTEYQQAPEQYNNLENLIAAKKLEASYLGQLGQSIEPVIQPLGYDWKIGIALLSSFAAREVFVGSLATIYNVGEADSDLPLIQRLKNEKRPETGEPVYDLALGLSLLIFYVLAMQCMSTLAITKKETNSWKWPMAQLVLMTGVAYIAALVIYQLLS